MTLLFKTILFCAGTANSIQLIQTADQLIPPNSTTAGNTAKPLRLPARPLASAAADAPPAHASIRTNATTFAPQQKRIENATKAYTAAVATTAPSTLTERVMQPLRRLAVEALAQSGAQQMQPTEFVGTCAIVVVGLAGAAWYVQSSVVCALIPHLPSRPHLPSPPPLALARGRTIYALASTSSTPLRDAKGLQKLDQATRKNIMTV